MLQQQSVHYFGILFSDQSHWMNKMEQKHEQSLNIKHRQLKVEVNSMALKKIKFLNFHRLKFIYSITEITQFYMNSMLPTLTNFFVKSDSPQPKLKDSLQIEILFDSKTFTVMAHLTKDKNQVFFEHGQQLFSLINSCKMVPLFIESEGKASVQEINLYDTEKSNYCIIRCKNLPETERLYSKLKRCISHKGFSQFYKPLKRLGRGTFATVYLIEHKYTKVRKAAKVFSYEGQKIQFKGKQALENQIKTLREIDHPNLIKYDGLYETDNLIYVVTEYLSGGTLDDMMKNKSVHTGEFVSKIIKDCLSGLNYLDSKQIMHRDIKPENIIYRKEEDQWVLGDFGLAAKSNEDYIYNKCGTMGYIAPEIMDLNEQNPKKYSQQCDIYSLGIIAYTLIIGSLPFRVQSQNYFDKKIVWDMFQKPQCRELNPAILHFLSKLLQKSPKQRFTAKQALQSPFFTNKTVVEGLHEYHERRRKQRYDKILKIANIQY